MHVDLICIVFGDQGRVPDTLLSATMAAFVFLFFLPDSFFLFYFNSFVVLLFTEIKKYKKKLRKKHYIH